VTSLPPQTSWSIRVPWPGGNAPKSVGCGVRELPASASGFTSGVFGSLASGIFTAGDAVTLEILIGNILGSLLPDSDGAEANAL